MLYYVMTPNQMPHIHMLWTVTKHVVAFTNRKCIYQ